MDKESILNKLKRKELDKNTILNILVKIVPTLQEVENRISSLQLLDEINIYNSKLYDFIENLFTSDESSKIRLIALKIINHNYLDEKKILDLLVWALENEKDIECLIWTVKTLIKLNSKKSKEVLLKFVNEIKNQKYIDSEHIYKNHKFQTTLENIDQKKNLFSLSHRLLGNIIINFFIIQRLYSKFYTVHFELNKENAEIRELDLSDIEYEVRGWKAEHRNNIRNLSEISGLFYLTGLEYLDLSNNKLSDIKELTSLQKLTHVNLANNQIEDDSNLAYLKKISNLKYLDLKGNGVAENVLSSDFEKNTIIKLETFDYFR